MFNKRALLFSFPLPLILVALWVWMSVARGPFHLGINSDPDYPYLINSAGLLEMHSPDLNAHPGTPVQVAGAVIILGTWVTAGHGRPVEDVLTRPEFYLYVMDAVFALGIAAILFLLGLIALHCTRSVAVLLCVQAAPLLSMQNIYPLVTVKPEIVLLPVALAFGAVVFWIYQDPVRAAQRKTALAFGVLAGLGVATKVTFIPLLVLPLIVLETYRLRLRYLIVFTMAFLVSILPIVPRMWDILRWNYNLVTHKGLYGQGERGFLDITSLGNTFALLVSNEPALPLFAVAGIILAIVFRKEARRDAQATLAWRAILAFSAVEIAQLIFVAKHPNVHYLLPSLALLGSHAACCFLLLRNARFAFAAAAVPVSAALLFAVPATLERHALLEQNRDAMAAFLQRVEEKTRGGVVVYFYRCSAFPYAMKFADDFCGNYFGPRLQAQFHEGYFYDIWKKKITTFSATVKSEQLRSIAGSRPIYFWGGVISQYPAEWWPQDFNLEQVDAAGVEALYRATPK